MKVVSQKGKWPWPPLFPNGASLLLVQNFYLPNQESQNRSQGCLEIGSLLLEGTVSLLDMYMT